MNIIILIVATTIGLIFLFLITKNSKIRKENLNVIKKEDKLHFFLSDDYFFSVKLNKNKIDNITAKGLTNEIENVKKNIRRVCFINFKNSELENRLNRILKRK